MEEGVSRVRIFDSVGLAMGFAVVLVAAGAVLDNWLTPDLEGKAFPTVGEIHRCILPVLDASPPPG